jgi:flagellar secretion chaperone FliS
MDNPSNEYLRSAVMTATPEQLHLMLYDGAIRFTKQGIEGIRTKKWEDSYNGFTRAQKIILEMINALNYDVDRKLCERMASLYHFIYRKLIEASVDRNPKPAEEALEVIVYQRQTWVMLMERMRQDRAGPTSVAVPGSASKTGVNVSQPALAGEATYGTLCVEG